MPPGHIFRSHVRFLSSLWRQSDYSEKRCAEHWFHPLVPEYPAAAHDLGAWRKVGSFDDCPAVEVTEFLRLKVACWAPFGASGARMASL